MSVENKTRTRHCKFRGLINTLIRRHCEHSEAIQSQKRTRQRSRSSSQISSFAPSPAFTIVELLVVIVVIAILAAITIVSYTNITKQAHASSLASGLNSAMKAFEDYKITSSITTEAYPSSLDNISSTLNLDSSITWSYTTTSAHNEYCLQGTVDGVTKSISSTNSSLSNAPCGTLDGLVGWWKLNGNAKDSSGNGNNGTVNGGAIPVVGQDNASNHAYSFDGSSGYINIPDNAVLDIGQPGLTMLAWAKSATLSSGLHTVIAKNSPYILWVYNTSDNYKLESFLHQDAWNVMLSSDNSIKLNTWQLLTVTYDGYTTKIYINGQLDATGTSLSGNLSQTSDPVTIGEDFNTRFFDGAIDDARLYGRALSASEIQALYSQGAQ